MYQLYPDNHLSCYRLECRQSHHHQNHSIAFCHMGMHQHFLLDLPSTCHLHLNIHHYLNLYNHVGQGKSRPFGLDRHHPRGPRYHLPNRHHHYLGIVRVHGRSGLLNLTSHRHQYLDNHTDHLLLQFQDLSLVHRDMRLE